MRDALIVSPMLKKQYGRLECGCESNMHGTVLHHLSALQLNTSALVSACRLQVIARVSIDCPAFFHCTITRKIMPGKLRAFVDFMREANSRQG